MNIKPYLKGTATYLPGVRGLVVRKTGGTNSARYCYSVWLRHLVSAHNSGLDNQPRVVAELGPGDSLGIGLAALLTGTTKYYAFDVIEYANSNRNLQILDELALLLQRRENIPGDEEFPHIMPRLDGYSFPHHILSDDRLAGALRPDRVDSIRQALINMGTEQIGGISIKYCVPWYDQQLVMKHTVDMLFSQAVLEHIDELEHAYSTSHRWLKPTGAMSHVIDFTSHGLTKVWNGHWTYSELQWNIIRGTRPWLINRQPYSRHIALLKEYGFRAVSERRYEDNSGIQRQQLAATFRNLPDEDLVISGAFIQAVKE